MRKLFLLLGLIPLWFSVGCGSGHGSASFGSGSGSGFTNSSLSGQYAFQITGFDPTPAADFRIAGVFTADGNKNITAGVADFSEGSTVTSGVAIIGSYAISSDGTGTATIQFADGTVVSLALTMASSSKIYLIPLQIAAASVDFTTGTGIALKQNTSAFAAAPSGNFAFRLHTLSSSLGSSAIVGAFNLSGGTVAGNEDLLRGGVLNSLTLTGLFNAPDSTNGRGTGTFTNSLGATSTFAYQMVDANTFFLISADPGVVGVGRAEKQSASAFTTSSLSGGYAFGSHGDTASLENARSVGRFTAGGDGTITAGVYDSVQDGVTTTNLGFTGSYIVASNGRVDVTLNPAAGTSIQEVFWLVSPSRAFFLIDDPTKVEDGTVDLQQTTTFANSTLSGQYAFVTDGFTTTQSFDRIGNLKADGSGGLTLNYLLSNSAAALQSVSLTGTYSVSANGRATGSVNTLSNNLVFYLISGTDAYILQNDTNTEIDGSMSKQQ